MQVEPRTNRITCLNLTSGLPAERIDERLRRASRIADVGQRAVAFYLAELQSRGLCQALGFPTAAAYAVQVLGMSARTARELVQVGMRLEKLERLDREFAEGRLTWSKVRRLARVVTRDTEVPWLEAVRHSSQDEVERMVRRVHEGDLPPGHAGLPGARFRIAIELDALQWQMWENARAKLAAETDFATDVKDVDALMEMVRLVLASDADGSVPGRKPIDGSSYKVVLRSSNDPGAGTTVEGDTGDAAVEDRVFDAARSDAETSPGLRRKVFARDGHRCRHCGSRRDLHAHHVVWRSRGGPTTLANLVTLCRRCHGLVHDGLLDVEVAQCAGREVRGPSIRFSDRRGAELDDSRIPGLRVTRSAAHGAAEPMPGERGIDREWLASHLHWFDASGGRLVLESAFRGRVPVGEDRAPASSG
jgi:hypothetical protein